MIKIKMKKANKNNKNLNFKDGCSLKNSTYMSDR